MASLVAEAQGDSNKVTEYLEKVQTCFDDVIDGIENGRTVSKKYEYDLTDLVVFSGLGGQFSPPYLLLALCDVW